MQIIPFSAHYQSVYTNFDISSFSLISCQPRESKVQYLHFELHFERSGTYSVEGEEDYWV